MSTAELARLKPQPPSQPDSPSFSTGEEKWEGEGYTDANGDAGMRIVRLSNGYRAAHDDLPPRVSAGPGSGAA